MTTFITGAKRQLGNQLIKIIGEGTSELGRLPLFCAQFPVFSIAVGSAEFPRSAKQSVYSALDNSQLRSIIGDSIRNWKVALYSFMKKYLEMERKQ